jgi:UDP-3-O-acyl N-acetylglucosamine deacetylase
VKTVVRKSIAREAVIEGVALHSGETVRVRLLPAESGEGIRFARSDLPSSPSVGLADVCREGPKLRSTLRLGNVEVHTIEHLLAVFHGFGITDVLVEVDGSEVPGMDGSALPFVKAMKEAGIAELPERIEVVTVDEPLEVLNDGARLEARPHPEGLRISYTLDYPNEPLAQGQLCLDVTAECFERELAPARTFCPLKEARALQAAGFGKGAGTHNTLVLEGRRVLDNSLRFPDETVRHKMLDLFGDLYLIGRPVNAHFIAHRSGHELNRAMVQRLGANLP